VAVIGKETRWNSAVPRADKPKGHDPARRIQQKPLVRPSFGGAARQHSLCLRHCHLDVASGTESAYIICIARSLAHLGCGRARNNTKTLGRTMKKHWHATAALAVGLASALTTGIACGAPLTFSQTYIAKHGPDDNFDARAGAEPDQAYPSAFVAAAQRLSAARAFEGISERGFDFGGEWKAIGPSVGNVPGPVTFTGTPSQVSGRVTSLVISHDCDPSSCVALVGAAGGGVWKTTNVLAGAPHWRPVSEGLATNSIGSLLYDPTDPSGSTIYVGTGEPNGSSDSEAGLGLYKSSDGGEHWSLVPGSFDAAHDRAVAAIAVDPHNSRHLWIGTAVARHGSSAVNGGRFTPPGAPPVGLYESIDGGLHFSLVFSVPADSVNPASPNGSDFFRGGVSKIVPYRAEGKEDDEFTQIYFSVFDYGLYRSTRNHLFEQLFASAGGGTVGNSLDSRTEFALAPMGRKLRVYLGDVGSAPADFYRTDNANVNAGALLTGGSNAGWIKLSNPKPGTAGFSSYDFCQGQCSYDMFVATPPGRPDSVWLGGSMQYGELMRASNGRAVVRSTNAGVSFTDMTNDADAAPNGMHPDQHVLAFIPGHGDAALIGSDGGVVRTSGAYTDGSALCASRGLTKAADLTDCKNWLSVIPTEITPVDAGLNTLQFQGIAVNAQDPRNDVIGGTQDNGTWAYDKTKHSWFESVGGDGGPPAISPVDGIRIHLYYSPAPDVNFHVNNPLTWDWIGDPLQLSGEAASFYVPLIADPKAAGTFFIGLQHVWRTTDNGGPQADLDKHCNEYFGDFTITCGDWVPVGGALGTTAGDLTSTAYGPDKTGSYVVSISHGPAKDAPLWVGTRRGRLFLSMNPNAADPNKVTYARIDTPAQPTRFISGIAIDPRNPLHAFVSFSGYDAYTPTTTGHVFEVTYDPKAGTAQWKNLSSGLGDQPVTGIAYDADGHRLYVATDFGVLVRREGDWLQAAAGMPPVAVYQLVLDPGSHLLYAATHGRGIYRLESDD
jgi:hypothetical protein